MNEERDNVFKAMNRINSSYYETGNKDSKEAGVVDCWLMANYGASCPFNEIAYLKDGEDPPDCILKGKNGDTLGVEMTELVHQETRTKSVKREPKRKSKREYDYYDWTPEKVLEKVIEIHRTKEKKIIKRYENNQSQFTELLLLIHTNEGAINFSMLSKAFEGKKITLGVFSHIHIIRPPEPRTDGFIEADFFSKRNVNQLYQIECLLKANRT